MDKQRNLGRIVAHIPARGGSKRCPAKNLRILGEKPMLAYAIECAQETGLFQNIIVNTDSEQIADMAQAWDAEVFHRSASLASDEATGDDFTADFMAKTGYETVVMISPVCPLIQVNDVRRAIDTYRSSDCDTLITCMDTHMQTFSQGHPVNIDEHEPLLQTQLNPVVRVLNWAVTIWDTKTFLASYERNKSGYLGTNRVLMPIDPMRAIKVSLESDFEMIEQLLKCQKEEIKEATFWSKEKSNISKEPEQVSGIEL